MSEIGTQRDGSIGSDARADRPAGRRRSDRIVGASRATQLAIEQALAASRSDLPLLVTGPSGAGKEQLARAVHAWSSRAANPFVVVSCAAINPALLAREIFGCAANVHAVMNEAHVGALSRAGAGSVLLDSIDELPEGVRREVATVISRGSFQPEGNLPPVALRARVMATALVKPTRSPFGEVPYDAIELLPLSERREDILPLAAHFLRLAAEEFGYKAVGFSSEARNALLTEPWIGNARELAERIRQAVQIARDGAISAEALLLASDFDEIPSFKEAKRAFETRYVVGLLRRCGGNISRAARLAKKDRKDFYDVIRRTGVDPTEFR
ncbi:MAG TPA: sigma 54-interacting transcriptional regulator [Myxococcota bacterium]|nr:sigma 54-interacting transcriptional regulator [Myxococcota bacterium]